MKNKFTSLFLTATLGLFCALQSFAGLQVQLNGGTNNVPGATSGNITNTYALYGDTSGVFTNGIAVGTTGPNQFFDLTKTTSADLQVSFDGIVNHNTNQTATFVFAGSVDNANWTNAAQTLVMTVPAAAVDGTPQTNHFVGWVHLNASGTIVNTATPPALALRSIVVQTNLILTNLQVKMSTRTGI